MLYNLLCVNVYSALHEAVQSGLTPDMMEFVFTEDGVTILYNANEHLVRSRSSKLNIAKWSGMKLANDPAIVYVDMKKSPMQLMLCSR